MKDRERQQSMIAAIDEQAALARTNALALTAKVATGLLPLGLAMVAAITGGSSLLLHAAAEGLGMALLAEVQERLEKRGKSPNWERLGLEQTARIAGKGSCKGGVLRSKWVDLLTNALDPDFPHQIRHEDVDLLDGLNPSDALLLLAIGSYGDEMRSDFHKTPQGAIMESLLRNNSELSDSPGYSFGLVRSYARAIFNQDCAIDDDEFRYALATRGNRAGVPGDKPAAIFNKCTMEEGGRVAGMQACAGWFTAILHPRAKRLLPLLKDPDRPY